MLFYKAKKSDFINKSTYTCILYYIRCFIGKHCSSTGFPCDL